MSDYQTDRITRHILEAKKLFEAGHKHDADQELNVLHNVISTTGNHTVWKGFINAGFEDLAEPTADCLREYLINKD